MEKLRDSEFRLLDIVWNNEPMTSRELVGKAGDMLGWKPTTTYTILKALENHGYCENVGSNVRSLVTREQVEIEDSKRIADYAKERFGGSLPKFIATFAGSNGMSDEEAREIISMLNEYTGK